MNFKAFRLVQGRLPLLYYLKAVQVISLWCFVYQEVKMWLKWICLREKIFCGRQCWLPAFFPRPTNFQETFFSQG